MDTWLCQLGIKQRTRDADWRQVKNKAPFPLIQYPKLFLVEISFCSEMIFKIKFWNKIYFPGSVKLTSSVTLDKNTSVISEFKDHKCY